MKKFLKSILNKTGHVLITKKHYDRVVEGPSIPNQDFFYLVKNIVDVSGKLVCFDIGANVGQTSKKLTTYFPNADIYSFEPIADTFKKLKENVGSLPHVKIFNEAMGDKPGELTIYHRVNSEWNSLVQDLNEEAKISGAGSEVIKINSIDNFLANNPIDRIHLLKSDTEGFEISVLEGAEKSLSDQLIDMVYLEVGFIKGDKQHTYLADIVDHLENYNYSFSGLFELSYGHDMKAYYGNALFMSPRQMEVNKLKKFEFR